MDYAKRPPKTSFNLAFEHREPDSGLFAPDRDVLSADERLDWEQRIGIGDRETDMSPLYNRRRTEDFLNRLQEIRQRKIWEVDLSPEYEAVVEKQRARDAARTEYDAKKINREQLGRMSDEYNSLANLLKPKLEVRALDLQQAVNGFNKANHLPSVKIKVDMKENPLMPPVWHSEGEIHVSAGLLARNHGGEIANSIYHELVHVERDDTVARFTSGDASLSAAQKKRAEELLGWQYQANASEIVQRYAQAGIFYRSIERKLREFETSPEARGKAESKFLSACAHDPGFAREWTTRLVTDETADRLLKLLDRVPHFGDKPMTTRESKQLRDLMSERLEALNKQREVDFELYMQNREEVEALLVGTQAQEIYNERITAENIARLNSRIEDFSALSSAEQARTASGTISRTEDGWIERDSAGDITREWDASGVLCRVVDAEGREIEYDLDPATGAVRRIQITAEGHTKIIRKIHDENKWIEETAGGQCSDLRIVQFDPQSMTVKSAETFPVVKVEVDRDGNISYTTSLRTVTIYYLDKTEVFQDDGGRPYVVSADADLLKRALLHAIDTRFEQKLPGARFRSSISEAGFKLTTVEDGDQQLLDLYLRALQLLRAEGSAAERAERAALAERLFRSVTHDIDSSDKSFDLAVRVDTRHSLITGTQVLANTLGTQTVHVGNIFRDDEGDWRVEFLSRNNSLPSRIGSEAPPLAEFVKAIHRDPQATLVSSSKPTGEVIATTSPNISTPIAESAPVPVVKAPDGTPVMPPKPESDAGADIDAGSAANVESEVNGTADAVDVHRADHDQQPSAEVEAEAGQDQGEETPGGAAVAEAAPDGEELPKTDVADETDGADDADALVEATESIEGAEEPEPQSKQKLPPKPTLSAAVANAIFEIAEAAEEVDYEEVDEEEVQPDESEDYGDEGIAATSDTDAVTKPERSKVDLPEANLGDSDEEVEAKTARAKAAQQELDRVVIQKADFALPMQVVSTDPTHRGINKEGAAVNYDGGSTRAVNIGGQIYNLVRPGGTPDHGSGSTYYFPRDEQTGLPRANGRVGPVKVRVCGVDSRDLEKLQKVLIPALEDDPFLRGRVVTWRTLDPNYVVNRLHVNGTGPGASGAQSKAFTIYTQSAADARKIAVYIDRQYLSQYPQLISQTPLTGGNLDVVLPGGSNRVSLSRDEFQAPPSLELRTRDQVNLLLDHPQFKVDDAINAKVLADPRFGQFKMTALYGKFTLKSEGLRKLEKLVGLPPETLVYDDLGNLLLNGNAGTGSGELRNCGVYASEILSPHTTSELSDRQALYLLAQQFGFTDPSALADFHLPLGGQFTHTQLRGLERYMNARPSSLRYDAHGNLFYQDNYGGKTEDDTTARVKRKVAQSGLVRAHFDIAVGPNGQFGARIDDVVAARLRANFSVPVGGTLFDGQLRELEQRLGLKENILGYSINGDLMMRTTSIASAPTKDGMSIYLDVRQAGMGFEIDGEPRSDRPAIYALYRHCSFDPLHVWNDIQKSIVHSTAPKRIMSFAGKTDIKPNRTYIVGRAGGRAADITINDTFISGQHLDLRTDEYCNFYIRDRGSRNGTYINGQLVQGEHALKSGDVLTTGDPVLYTFQWENSTRSQHLIRAGVLKFHLRVGESMVLGRGNFAGNPFLSARHVTIGLDDRGIYLRDEGSTNGTIILRDGSHIWLTKNGAIDGASGTNLSGPGTPFYLFSSDEVWLGGEVWNGGERLSLERLDVSWPVEHFRVNTPPSVAARNQSNEFARKHQVEGKLHDEFLYSGQYRELNVRGKISNTSVATTYVDKSELAPIIQDVRARFGHMPPQEKAFALAYYVRDRLMPTGLLPEDLNEWYTTFNDANAGCRVTLGYFLQEGRGIAPQMGLLFKVLADELGLKVKLIRGNGTEAGTLLNHVWNTVDFGDGPCIFDLRQRIYNVPVQNFRVARPGIEIAEQHGMPLSVSRAADRVRHQKQNTWVVESVDPVTGEVTVRHFGTRPISIPEMQEFKTLNKDKLGRDNEQLIVGDEYNIRRSSGAIEEWRLTGFNPDGALRLSSDIAFRDVLPALAFAAYGSGLLQVWGWLPRAGEAPDTARDRMLRELKKRRTHIEGTNHQSKPNLQHLEKQIEWALNTLKDKSEISRYWLVFPVAEMSAAHRVGWDYLLVNTKTGAMHPLDVTTDPAKLATPRVKGVPAIRRDGILFYEDRWFDRHGKLKSDDSNPELAEAARQFPNELMDRFRNLTSSDTPFVLGETPFPDILVADLDTQKMQVRGFIDWLEEKSAQSHSRLERKHLDEYADMLETKAFADLNISLKKPDLAVFRKFVDDAARRAVLDVLISKLTKMRPAARATSATTELSIDAKLNVVLHAGDGNIHSAGLLTDALEKGREEIVKAKHLRELVPEKNIAKWMDKSGSKTEEQFLRRVRDAAVIAKNDIAALARRNRPDPNNAMTKRLLERLKLYSEDILLGLALAPSTKHSADAATTMNPGHGAIYEEIKTYWDEMGGGGATGADGGPVPKMISTLEMVLADHAKIWESERIDHLRTLLENYRNGDPGTIAALHSLVQMNTK